MATIKNVANYLHELLDVDAFKDYALNGLQVQGKEKLKKIVMGVSATQALIEAAIGKDADAILVHHGWFWDKENPRIIGMKHKRLQLLILRTFKAEITIKKELVYGIISQNLPTLNCFCIKRVFVLKQIILPQITLKMIYCHHKHNFFSRASETFSYQETTI